MSMSFYIDVKYASMLSTRVRNFKKQNDKTWNFSCPICGDSASNKFKARGYIYAKKGTLLYKCHNCNAGLSFSNLLKQIDSNLYSEYSLEKYKTNSTHNHMPREIEAPALTPKAIVIDPLRELSKISELVSTHPAVRYIQARMIPKEYWNLLYFCPKYATWVSKYHKQIPTDHDIPRLIIPHFNQSKKLIGWSGRAFGKETLRYHNVKLGEEQLLYGLERLDLSKTLYVTEGQLDSLFIDNCIAASGVSAFDSKFMQDHKSNIVLVIDNEPRSIQIVKAVDNYISKGYSVVLFPDTVEQKDINLMIQAGLTKKEIKTLITTNTFRGMSATLKMTQWRKI